MHNEPMEQGMERLSDRGTSPRRKAGNPLDTHVGNRLRLRRTLLGMTQERLASRLGLTFQQVQKYEKGVNRISAGRLYQLSQILNVPLDYFYGDVADGQFADSGTDSSGAESIMTFISSNEGVELCLAFMQLKDPKIRRRFVDLVKSLADDEELAH